jgi:hypothetical protein
MSMLRLFLPSLLLFVPSFVNAQSLDSYGGRTDVSCTKTNSYFHLEQLGNKWWFCTSEGHGLIAMSVSIGAPANPTLSPCTGNNNLFPIIIAKYGDASYNWGWQTLKRITAWGFNAVGQDSIGFVKPTETCTNCLWPGHTQPIKLPYIIEAKPAENASQNMSNYITSAVKDSIVATNSHWKGYRGAALFDVFDPGLATVWQKELANTSNPAMTAIRQNNPWVLAIITDDADYFSGAGASPDFVTGHTSPNPAWTTLLTSPVQTYNAGTAIGNKKLLYTITENFSKTLALDPSSCSITAPCSLRDYLKKKYETIDALNAAWDSNYTTFDSTATQVTGETIGKGDGAKTTFTSRLEHGNIDPYSVAISVAGTLQMGDCPWVHISSATVCLNSLTNVGTFGSPIANLIVQSTSTVNYSTGAVTLHFVKAPAAGAAITVNYQYGGWMQGGTGLMDEDGTNTAWVGTNAWCLEGANPSYPMYFSCASGLKGGNPSPNANPKLGADLDEWVMQLSAKYFKVMHDNLKAVSKLPYFGLDVVGGYGAPAFSKFEQGAAPYLDGFFDGGFQQQESSSEEEYLTRLKYHTQYIGNKPFMTFNAMLAQSDSSYSCKSAAGRKINYPNQEARGQAWFSEVQSLLTTPSFNGTIQIVGLNFWDWQDFLNLNLGLVSLSDNAYDGSEAVTGAVTCDSYYTSRAACGRETANYGNAIMGITAGNRLWLTLIAPLAPADLTGNTQ